MEKHQRCWPSLTLLLDRRAFLVRPGELAKEQKMK